MEINTETTSHYPLTLMLKSKATVSHTTDDLGSGTPFSNASRVDHLIDGIAGII